MTSKCLQDALVEEIVIILKDIRVKNANGEPKPVNVYPQRLPIFTEDEEDETQCFPYAVVRIGDSDTENDDDPWHVVVDILIGVYDDDLKGQGHLHILTMVERITDRFMEKPLLDGKYRAEQKMQKALQDEDTYPYYFGGVEMKFEVPKIGRRDEWS